MTRFVLFDMTRFVEGDWQSLLGRQLTVCRDVRPPLKKCLFLIQRPGEDITAEGDFFFFMLPFSFLFFKNVIIFL